MSLRLASFNLFSGRRLVERGPAAGSTDDLLAAVGELGADVLAVQEVDRDQPRSGRADQLRLAAEAMGATGATSSRFVRTVRGTPGEPRVWPLDESAPGYGIGLVSRVPVAEWHELRMPGAPGRFPLPLPDRTVLWLPEEPRAAVAVVLHEPRITIACTHLSFVPGINARQLRSVRRWLLDLPGPRVLLGDLNLPGGLPRRITGWEPLAVAATFPSTGPKVQLDHALAHGLPAGTRTSGRAHRLGISDHLALTVDLMWS